MKLNLGCGKVKKEGFLNIDISKEVNPDKVFNLERGLPFLKDNSVDLIYSSHCLEHIWNFHQLLEEMYRASKPGAIWELILPFDNLNTRTNIFHYRTFSFGSFKDFKIGAKGKYFNKITLEQLHKTPHKLTKLFYNLFPFLKKEIRYKFEVIK